MPGVGTRALRCRQQSAGHLRSGWKLLLQEAHCRRQASSEVAAARRGRSTAQQANHREEYRPRTPPRPACWRVRATVRAAGRPPRGPLRHPGLGGPVAGQLHGARAAAALPGRAGVQLLGVRPVHQRVDRVLGAPPLPRPARSPCYLKRVDNASALLAGHANAHCRILPTGARQCQCVYPHPITGVPI